MESLELLEPEAQTLLELSVQLSSLIWVGCLSLAADCLPRHARPRTTHSLFVSYLLGSTD